VLCQPCTQRSLIGASGGLRDIISVVRKVALSDSTVLIRGETGTGKELIATALHDNSRRAGRPFVKVNCAALPDTLLESELFGHERGAFTGADKLYVGRFEQADSGTLLLDEVGDMSNGMQAKVLRFLQEQEFERLGGSRTVRANVRVIAATHRDLATMIAERGFREDLFYRLNVVSIEIPPLRERREDLYDLAHFFLRQFAQRLGKELYGFDTAAMKTIEAHKWPGNVRELENTIERAAVLAEGPLITTHDLRVEASLKGSDGQLAPIVRIPPAGVALKEIERIALVEALRMTNGVQKDAAGLLSISPRAFSYRIRSLRIHTVARTRSSGTSH
jgi:Nif-specific regulatory protein